MMEILWCLSVNNPLTMLFFHAASRIPNSLCFPPTSLKGLSLLPLLVPFQLPRALFSHHFLICPSLLVISLNNICRTDASASPFQVCISICAYLASLFGCLRSTSNLTKLSFTKVTLLFAPQTWFSQNLSQFNQWQIYSVFSS